MTAGVLALIAKSAGQPRDAHGRWTSTGDFGDVTFHGDKLPRGVRDVERDAQHDSERHGIVLYDVGHDRDGNVHVANVRLAQHDGQENVPARQALNRVQARMLEREIAAQEHKGLSGEVDEAAEREAAERQAAEDEKQRNIHAAVDAAVASGWRPKPSSSGGGYSRADEPQSVRQYSMSPSGRSAVIDRLNHHGFGIKKHTAIAKEERRDAHGRWASGGIGTALGQKVKNWLGGKDVSQIIHEAAHSGIKTASDPETIKSVLGAAINAAAGHLHPGHTTTDADVIAGMMQHVEVGLRMTAEDARDTLRSVVGSLVRHRRAELAKAEDDDILAALERLHGLLGKEQVSKMDEPRTFLDFLVLKDATTGDVHATTAMGNEDDDKDEPAQPKIRGNGKGQKLPVTGLTAAAAAVQQSQQGGGGQQQPVGKVGARNSAADLEHIQAMHDHACALGAKCADPDDDGDVDMDAPAETYVKRDTDWSVPFTVAKADPDQQLVFGWASIVEMDGRPIIDKQGDIIPVDELEKAAYDFMLHSRENDDLHIGGPTGRCVESVVFTKEKQQALGIDLGKVGWWVGFRVDDPALWAAHKRGERPEFSIGGGAVRVPTV